MEDELVDISIKYNEMKSNLEKERKKYKAELSEYLREKETMESKF